MKETILVNQVHLPTNQDDLQLCDIDIPESKEDVICGHLQIVTKSDSYLKIKTTESGKKFRVVFFINNRITALSVIYTSISGNNYQITAKKGHAIGIECVK
ncbi:hypothetical protein [Ulvibacterium marinum]|uniref:Uncharacterized protein n=1 Tax=Ulvibacterium marinum TaxID=2419782 RepID=A0A3B0C1M1_9FLAO|nr:hypothetical protein [Ulvibacterium marinum]RKN78731.1 hypothetical protein D7Z94_21290 [Ulvibacterium marinum]